MKASPPCSNCRMPNYYVEDSRCLGQDKTISKAVEARGSKLSPEVLAKMQQLARRIGFEKYGVDLKLVRQFRRSSGHSWFSVHTVFTRYNHALPPNSGAGALVASMPGGTVSFIKPSCRRQCATLDGGSRFISDDIDLIVWRELVTAVVVNPVAKAKAPRPRVQVATETAEFKCRL